MNPQRLHEVIRPSGLKEGPQMGGAQNEQGWGAEGMLATAPWPGWDGGGGDHEI